MRLNLSALRATALALSAIALTTAPVRADEFVDFYKGKTFELLIGGSSGGGYDFYGRSLAQFYGKHIPVTPP